MNDINAKQNDIENMKFLFMKQYYYDSARNKYVIAILVDFIATLINIFLSFVANDFLYYTLLIISIILYAIVVILLKLIKMAFTRATNYMDLFDHNVLDTDKAGDYDELDLYNLKDNIINKNKSLFEKRITSGDKKGIKYTNWFEKVSNDKEYLKAVLYCQKQSITWTVALIVSSCMINLFIIALVSIPIVALIKSYSIMDLILFLITIIPNSLIFVFITVNTIKKINLVNRLKEKLEKYFKKELDKGTLDSIEEDIYSMRLIPTFEFGFVYRIIYKYKHLE